MKILFLLATVSILFSALIFISLPEKPVPPVQSHELSRPGIHWHARVTIIINGEEIPIPANVGISETEQAVQHTHEWDNIIHIEASSSSAENTRLGTFFHIWGVRLTKDCLFQYCNEDFHMLVNDEENFDFDEYQMKDGDDILLVLNSLF